jgi:hypothetical protein
MKCISNTSFGTIVAMRKNALKHFVRLLMGVILLSCSSCHALRVYTNDKVPPSFTFSVGAFAECCTDFRVFAVFEEESKLELWRIVANTVVDRNEAGRLTIQYGKLPDRFVQEIPASGPPPQLTPGKHYVAVAGGTSYVPWSRVRFVIENDRIVNLPTGPGSLP